MTSKADYKRELKDSRRAHDARFEVDHPKPTAATIEKQPTPLDRAVAHVWVLWLALAVAGAVISAPHTIATLRAILPGHHEAVRVAVSLSGFVGVECGLLGLSLVQALNRDERRPWVLWGLLSGLFVAALVFNEADALRAGFNVVSVIAGALGPLLLTLAGHRLAVEVTLAGERSSETRLARELSRWTSELDRSWLDTSNEWIGRDDTKGRTSTKPKRTSTPGSEPSPRIVRTLRTFAERPDATFTERAGLLDTSESTVKRWVQEAVDGGLMARPARGVYALTPAGERLAENGKGEDV
jgi:hypothetical protein